MLYQKYGCMTKEPLFVIVLPTYNRSKLLIRALKSISNQRYNNWRCIIVDDGSSDDTNTIVSNFIAEENRFKYIKQENEGVNSARNNAIYFVESLNEDCYYMFIDDDDYLSDDCLSKASSMVLRHSGYRWFGFNCINSKTHKKISKVKRYGANNYLRDLMFGKNWRGDITSFIHSSIIGDLRFCTEIKNGEEWYFWSQLAINDDVYIVDEIGSFKDYLPAGLTKTGFNRDKAIEVIQLKLKILSPIVGDKMMIHQIVTLAKNYYQSGQKQEAKAYLKKAFELNPFYFRQYFHWIKQFFYKS